jgi:hypothetical protein
MKKIIFAATIMFLSIINVSSFNADCSSDINEIKGSVNSKYVVIMI